MDELQVMEDEPNVGKEQAATLGPFGNFGAREISAPKFEMVRFQVAARSKFVPLFGSHSKLCTA